jgi:hypothetical protein
VDVSLASLRSQILAMRSWDSSGETQNNRIRQSLNVALNRMSNDVPHALVPDEEHVVLYPQVKSSSDSVAARVVTFENDKRLLEFTDASGNNLAHASSATTWRPTLTGEWDGLMHIEITDGDGRVHRRQCLEWFTDGSGSSMSYLVTLDRPYNEIIANTSASGRFHFRIHQPEFFVTDDVIELLEPARIFDGSRQQVWKIDTAGAGRQDMLDYQGNSQGRPYRCWRGRHFQLPAPTKAPKVMESTIDPVTGKESSTAKSNSGSSVVIPTSYKWDDDKAYRRGKWAICYTYVLGRKDEEWQQSPLVTPGGDTSQDSSYGITWAYKSGTVLSTENRYSGIHDPQFESAPSPVTTVTQSVVDGIEGAMVFSATDVDSLMGFGDASFKRYGRSGIRIRYYVAYLEADETGKGKLNDIETSPRFHLLCEVEPHYDMVAKLTADGTDEPKLFDLLGESDEDAARVVWTGTELYDSHRPLPHSTGYYAWKVFPHQDARYELDFRVSRLPKKYVHDEDTAPIHPEAIPTLLELALYYVCLVDGNDQVSAQAHLTRYFDLLRVFRDRYGNPGGIVEPVPILGYSGTTPLW